jgi:hypothetical protein
LSAAGEIDDAQAGVGKTDRAVRPYAVAIGSTMADHVDHAAQQSRIGPAIPEIEYASYPAHV